MITSRVHLFKSDNDETLSRRETNLRLITLELSTLLRRMKIDRVEIYHVQMPLLYPWRTAYGEDPNIDSVLVKLDSEGEHGWGETTPFAAPAYSPEWAQGVFTLIQRHLASRIIGVEIDSAEDLLNKVAMFKGNPFAKAGLELAWWVLAAKLKGMPLHRLLGGTGDDVSIGADYGVQDDMETLLTKIQGAIDHGYPRVKLKFRRGWDINMLQAVRDRFPDFTFHIDCNSSFTLADTELFKKVDRFELAMIEQPLDHADLLDHAELQKQLETPICLDESITSPKAMENAVRLRSCRYVNIKTGRVGGISNAVRIHDICRDAGIPCWVGGNLESAVGSGISVELATLPNIKYPADIFPSKVQYASDLSAPEVVPSAPGKLATSRVPGIPYEPRPEMLKLHTVMSATVTR